MGCINKIRTNFPFQENLPENRSSLPILPQLRVSYDYQCQISGSQTAGAIAKHPVYPLKHTFVCIAPPYR
jgi:hypothetical protein